MVQRMRNSQQGPGKRKIILDKNFVMTSVDDCRDYLDCDPDKSKCERKDDSAPARAQEVGMPSVDDCYDCLYCDEILEKEENGECMQRFSDHERRLLSFIYSTKWDPEFRQLIVKTAERILGTCGRSSPTASL